MQETTVSKRLKEAARRAGFVHQNDPMRVNVNALRRAADLPQSTVHEIISGLTDEPGGETLRKLAAATDTTVEWLLGQNKAPSPEYRRGWRHAVHTMRGNLNGMEEPPSEKSPPVHAEDVKPPEGDSTTERVVGDDGA